MLQRDSDFYTDRLRQAQPDSVFYSYCSASTFKEKEFLITVLPSHDLFDAQPDLPYKLGQVVAGEWIWKAQFLNRFLYSGGPFGCKIGLPIVAKIWHNWQIFQRFKFRQVWTPADKESNSI